ncbi:HEAT repeat domain-containing protein (plasmid) [Streptomyces avidinii]|uniref:HEAT repeat domain-containing protein n=1 Tax=Streptomyces avidinii TaxID=1895 RepID=UPI003870D5F6|nr:HEAT repeat domain-containing protein [Streptomyces avidinii]
MLDPLPDGVRRWLRHSHLPPVAVQIVITHPDPEVRKDVTENYSLPPDALAALTEDPDAKVRWMAVMMAGEYDLELPVELTVRLATSSEARLRYVAIGLPGLPDETRLALAEDPDPRVRAHAIGSWSWPRLRPEVRAAAEANCDPRVREAVERASRIDVSLPTTLADFLAEPDERRRDEAAYRAPVDADLAVHLVAHDETSLRRGAVRNPHVPAALALTLAADPEPSVRFALSLRADISEEQRSAIDYTVPEGRYGAPAWVEDRFGDPDALRKLSASSHVLLRRAVTCAPELPGDVVERLAADEDYFVRLMLCENDHAPHELLVEMFADWKGLSWGMLASRRNFARPGLARFADAPNYRLRLAALSDPQATPELVERLSHDPDDIVRGRAAGDPRLPHARLVELLGSDCMPYTAACNPALPAPLMHQLLDIAGVKR